MPPLRLAAVPPARAQTPEALVEGLLHGEPLAASSTWRAYAPMVYRLLRRLMGPDQEVDDLAQEVFLRVFSSIGTLREASALSGFIQGVGVRVVQKELRRRWVRRWLRLSSHGDLPEESVTGDEEGQQALRRFYRLLDTVDTPSRTVFVLRHVEGRELVEVALLAGISLATAKRKLARVEARLAALVAEDKVLSGYSGRGAPWLTRGGER